MSLDRLTKSIFGTILNSGALIHAPDQITTEMTAVTTHGDKHLRDDLAKRVLTVENTGFDALSMDIFWYQFTYNPIYREYCRLLGKSTHNVREPADIPFLPISLFKQHLIQTNVWNPKVVYESSTTTGQLPSRHAVRSFKLYQDASRRGFFSVFDLDVSDFTWIALLPSYIERPNSSLIAMVSDFISAGKPGSGFVSRDTVLQSLQQADQGNDPVAFIGVSFALLDFTESYRISLRNTMVIETGGMKGRRSELTRSALHERLCAGYGVSKICSEYGMTELLSQAWSHGSGLFQPAPTLRVCIRDISDPLNILEKGTRGGINIVDLANLDTCAFIATDDVGLLHNDGLFEVLGRFDASELRGCNLMVDQVR